MCQMPNSTITLSRHPDESTRDLDRFRAALRDGTGGSHAYVLLLGLETFDLARLLHSVEKGFAFRCYDRLARNVGLPTEQLLDLVDIPRRTLIRRKNEGRFSPNESDRLLRVARLFGKTLELFEGDRENALDWLSTAQTAMGGAIPLQIARSEMGAREVEAVLGRLEHGVFS